MGWRRWGGAGRSRPLQNTRCWSFADEGPTDSGGEKKDQMSGRAVLSDFVSLGGKRARSSYQLEGQDARGQGGCLGGPGWWTWLPASRLRCGQPWRDVQWVPRTPSGSPAPCAPRLEGEGHMWRRVWPHQERGSLLPPVVG